MSVSYTWEGKTYLKHDSYIDQKYSYDKEEDYPSLKSESEFLEYNDRYTTWSKCTLKRSKNTPARATGVIFCRTVKAWTWAHASDDYEDNCGVQDDDKTITDKFTVKFGNTITIRAKDAPDCSCTPLHGSCNSHSVEGWTLESIEYSYD